MSNTKEQNPHSERDEDDVDKAVEDSFPGERSARDGRRDPHRIRRRKGQEDKKPALIHD